MSDQKYFDLIYLNNCLGSFFSDFLKWMGNAYYPDFKQKIISTYSKAVTKLINESANQQDQFDVFLPAIILDPSGEFTIVEQTDRMWSYSQLAPGLGSRIFDPIYMDDDVKIVPIFHRYSGTIQVNMLLQSIYEYLDMRVQTMQFFKGENRWSRPFFVNSFIVIPDELINIKYVDENGNTRLLEWDKTNLENKLVVNVNQNKNVIPVVLTPTIKYTGMSDNSTKTPGQDLEAFSFGIDFEYEIDLPVYLYIESDYKIILPPTITVNSGYEGERYDFPEDFIVDDNETETTYRYLRAYLIEMTQSKILEIQDNDNSIPIQQDMTDKTVIVMLEGHKLEYNKDYTLNNNVMKFFIEFEEGEILEYAIYVKV